MRFHVGGGGYLVGIRKNKYYHRVKLNSFRFVSYPTPSIPTYNLQHFLIKKFSKEKRMLAAAQASVVTVAAASAAVGLLSLVVGSVLIRKGVSTGSINPHVSAATSGLLIGIGMIVLLSESLEGLKDTWETETIFVAFLASPLVMFCIDHCILEHDPRSTEGTPAAQAAVCNCVGWGAITTPSPKYLLPPLMTAC